MLTDLSGSRRSALVTATSVSPLRISCLDIAALSRWCRVQLIDAE